MQATHFQLNDKLIFRIIRSHPQALFLLLQYVYGNIASIVFSRVLSFHIRAVYPKSALFQPHFLRGSPYSLNSNLLFIYAAYKSKIALTFYSTSTTFEEFLPYVNLAALKIRTCNDLCHWQLLS